MALVTKKTAAAGAGGVAALGGGAYGIVKATEGEDSSDKFNIQKIKDVLSEDLLPTDGSDFANEWKSLANKLASESNISEELKDIKEEENKATEGEKGNKLKTWCKSQGEQASKESELLNLVKEWCVYTIENKKIEGELANLKEKSSGSELYYLMQKLHRFSPENELTKEFKDAKSSTSLNSNDEWGELKKACEKTYQRGYRGESGKAWTQFKSFCYKPTIEDKLWGTTLPEDSNLDGEWDEKVSSISKSEIEEAKKSNDKTKLKKWCKDQYSKKHDATSEENKNLFNEVKKLCTLTIKEKLDNQKILSTEDKNNQAEWTKNFEKLKKESVTGNHPKVKDFLEIKNGGESIDWEDLKFLCKEIYEEGYKGSNDELWKLAEKYCTK